MNRKFFGTDGVRGRANTAPMTADAALQLGQAAGVYLAGGRARGRIVVGKDTRLSGYMLESALVAGLTSVGLDVMLLGPVPTPAVGMLARSLRADGGVMISASHNPFEDNGIKLFGPDGFKLSDEAEAMIEALMDGAPSLAAPERIGRALRIEGALARYAETVKLTLPRSMRLDGLRIVVDCANGAAYRAAPEVLTELGAEVRAMGDRPDGININAGCGSTDTAACRRLVVETGADLGIALDGDADRVILIDEKGAEIDGDQLMAAISQRFLESGRLSGGAVAATVMSNLGFERWLCGRGIGMVRTSVGDRYVVEAMRARGLNVGGEQSGHVILTDYSTTGDGLTAALQALAVMVQSDRRASEALRLFEPTPQLLRNVRYEPGARPLDTPSVRAAIVDAQRRIAGTGRILVRPSGTEPLVRVMGESEDPAALAETVEMICAAVAQAGAGGMLATH